MHARLKKIRALRRLRRCCSLRRHVNDERGIQLVELAIVVPIFVLLFAATAEFGRYFYEYTTLAKASRAGARYLATAAVILGDDTEDTNAKNIVVYGNSAGSGSPIVPGLTRAHVVISRQGQVATVPETVTVKITGFKHQPIFDLGQLLNITSLSTNVDVKPSVTMRYLLTQPAN